MVNFKACVQKKRRDGNYMVYIRIAHNRTISYVKTDLLIKDKEVKQGDIKSPLVFRKCLDLIDEYTEKCNHTDIQYWKASEVAEYLTNRMEILSFSDYCRQFTTQMDNEGRQTTSQNYKLAIKRLEEFTNKKNLQFTDITSLLINAWIESMKNTRNSKNGYPKAIKTMFNKGCDTYNDYDHNIIKISHQPFKKVKIPRPKKAVQRAVAVETMKKFFSTNINDKKAAKGGWISRAERAKDVCLLIFCLAGINTADLYYLKKENLINWTLCYNRKKTKGRRDDEAYIEIEVPQLIRPLFNKYEGTDALFSFAKIYANHKNFNKCINEGIADVLKCYVQSHPKETLEYMTTYSMRHTWATIAKNKCEASIELIAFSLNHGSAHRVTERYIKKDFTPISILNEKVISVVFEELSKE